MYFRGGMPSEYGQLSRSSFVPIVGMEYHLYTVCADRGPDLAIPALDHFTLDHLPRLSVP
jgi:hypothetical protein